MELGTALTSALLAGQGMTDCLHRFLDAIGSALAAPRLAIYDYDEDADAFDLLYFLGHSDEARTALHRRVFTPGLRDAIGRREAFLLDAEGGRALAVPLYFQHILEAVLVLERDAPWGALEQYQQEAHLVSRFVGLFMSSRRLPVNVRQESAAAQDLARAREVQLCVSARPAPGNRALRAVRPQPLLDARGRRLLRLLRTHEGRVQGIVADACGHGMGAALIMSTFRGLLYADVPCGEGIAPAFSRVNTRLYRDAERLQYLTGVFFDYQERTGELRYLNAGHFEPMILHPDGAVSRLRGGGPPLGMLPEAHYAAHTAHTKPGDLLDPLH